MKEVKALTLIKNQCQLFGWFGYVVQFILAILSFLSLVVKRHYETPKRSFRIWFLDISKQGIATMFLHFVNLFIAVVMTKQNEDDACIWYLINILLDTSFSIILIWLLIKILHSFALKKNINFLISGNYFKEAESNEEDDYKIDYKIWSLQASLYLIFSLFAKGISFSFQIFFPNSFEKFGKYMLSSVSLYPKLELVTVMIIIPFITTCFQFWVIDNILKESHENIIHRSSKAKLISSPIDIEIIRNEEDATNNSKINVFSIMDEATDNRRSSIKNKNINIENTKCHDKTSGVERSIKWDLTEAESYLNSSEHQHVKKINDAKTPYVVIEETDDMYLNKLKEVNKIQVSKDMMEEVCRKIEEHKNQIEEGEKS